MLCRSGFQPRPGQVAAGSRSYNRWVTREKSGLNGCLPGSLLLHTWSIFQPTNLHECEYLLREDGHPECRDSLVLDSSRDSALSCRRLFISRFDACIYHFPGSRLLCRPTSSVPRCSHRIEANGRHSHHLFCVRHMVHSRQAWKSLHFQFLEGGEAFGNPGRWRYSLVQAKVIQSIRR